MLLTLIFVSVALLVLERVDNQLVQSLRATSSSALAPVLEITSEPALQLQRLRRQVVSMLDMYGEIERLKAENQELRQWQRRAQQLDSEARQLRKLLEAVDDSKFEFRTGRIITDSVSPFVRSLLVNAGRAQGVVNGYAVVNSAGLVGRVVDTGERSSRVLLLTDLNSRIPVQIGEKGERAILRGNNDEMPVLEFLSPESTVALGDAVTTSGQDGLLPRGLQIGRVVRSGGVMAVELQANPDQIDFVSILFYAAPALELANGPDAGSEREHVASKAK